MEPADEAHVDIKEHNQQLNDHSRHSLAMPLPQQPINLRQEMRINQ